MANSTRKIYGVSGMMEWQALIICGKVHVTVPFTGGSMNGYGITPAKYTTEDPFMQQVIERSEYYRKGKIVLLHEMEGTGKYQAPEVVGHADAGTHKPGAAATASAVLDSALNPDGAPAAQQQDTGDADDTDAPGATEQDTDEGENLPTTTADGKAIVDVTDLDDARNYLVEEFGVTMSSLRYKVNVYRCAEEHNVVFRGIKEDE